MFLRLNKFIVLLTLFMAANPSHAIEVGDLELHGFISQSFMKTNGNKFILTDSESGSFDFTEAGLSMHYQPWSRVFLSTMLLSRNFGDAETNEEDLTVDHLLVGFNLYSGKNSEFNLRLGRLKNPYGLYNETRDFPFSRSGIVLPQSMYFEDGRNLSLRTEGIELEMSANGVFGGLTFNWLYGNSTEGGGCLPLYETCTTDTDARNIVRIIYDFPGNRLKFGTSYFKVNAEAEGGYAYSQAGNIVTWVIDSIYFENRFLIYSLQYEGDDWVISSEYTHPVSHWGHKGTITVNDLGSGSSTSWVWIEQSGRFDQSRHFYLELQYHFNHKYSGFLRHGIYYPNKDDKEGVALLSPGDNPRYDYHEAFIAGATWNITDDMLLRGEYHYIEGAAHAINEIGVDYDRYWGMFLMQFCLRF